jgi:hypothetical protein
LRKDPEFFVAAKLLELGSIRPFGLHSETVYFWPEKTEINHAKQGAKCEKSPENVSLGKTEPSDIKPL